MGSSIARRVLIGGSALTGAAALQAAVGLAASIVLARLLEPEAFGRFAIVIATVSIVLTLLSLRLEFIVFRVPEEQLTSRLQDVYFSASLIETIVVALVAIGWLIWLRLGDIFSITLVVSQCLAHWLNVGRAFFERGMPYGKLAVIETTAAIGGHLTAVGIALAGGGIGALYLREAVSAGVLGCGLALVGGLTWRSFIWPTIAEWRRLLREISPIWLDAISEGLFQRLILMAAAWIGGERGAGWYFMAHSLAARPHQFLAPAVVRAASGWFRHHQAEKAARARGRDLLLAATVTPLALVAVVAFIFSDPLVPFVLGENWRGAASVFAALCGLIAFTTPFEILRVYGVIAMRTNVLLAGRLMQYVVVAIGFAALSLWQPIDVVVLAGLVSASAAAAFAVLWLVLRNERA